MAQEWFWRLEFDSYQSTNCWFVEELKYIIITFSCSKRFRQTWSSSHRECRLPPDPIGPAVGPIQLWETWNPRFGSYLFVHIISLRRVLIQGGFEILEEHRIPAPFYLALGEKPLGDFLIGMNHLLLRISRILFSYQIGIIAKATPTLEVLLDRAVQSGSEKEEEIKSTVPDY